MNEIKKYLQDYIRTTEKKIDKPNPSLTQAEILMLEGEVRMSKNLLEKFNTGELIVPVKNSKTTDYSKYKNAYNINKYVGVNGGFKLLRFEYQVDEYIIYIENMRHRKTVTITDKKKADEILNYFNSIGLKINTICLQ